MRERAAVRGRDGVISTTCQLLTGGDARLVTLTGFTGVGTTTVARSVVHDLPDRALWIDLDRPIPGGLLTQIAGAAGSSSEHVGDVGAVLDAVPRLVVLDGTSATADAAVAVGDLVASTVSTRFLVTSRSPLRVRGEQVVRIEPLRGEPAVQLFLDTAAASGAHLALDAEIRRDIAVICERVGGLPAAIEIAASRTVAFSPATMRRLIEETTAQEVLAGAAGGSELFAAISWSESTLRPEQRHLVGAMAAFAGPVPIDAIAAVTDRDSGELIDDVSELVDAHLLDAHHGRHTGTFALPPIVREHLRTTGRPDPAVVEQHARWALDTAAANDRSARVDPTVELVERDLQAVLRTALKTGDTHTAATLAVALGPILLHRGVRASDAEMMAAVARATVDAEAAPGLRALTGAWSALFHAERAVVTGDVAGVAEARDTALTLSEQTDPPTRLAVLWPAVLAARVLTDRDVSIRLCQEGLELADELGDELRRTWFEIFAGMLAHQEHRIDDAVRMGQAALGRARQLGDTSLVLGAAGLLLTLPADARIDVPLPTVRQLVDLAVEIGDLRALLWLRPAATAEALGAGDHPTAARLAVEHLATTRSAAAWNWGAISVMNLVLLAAAEGDAVTAARFHGMVAGHLEVLRAGLPVRLIDSYERAIGSLRQQLGDAGFDAAAGSAALLSVADAHAEAVRYGRAVANRVNGEDAETTASSPITARESEILDRLVAGDRNADIARRLGISPKTVMHHTSSIYRKLGVRGRSEAIVWALSGSTATAL